MADETSTGAGQQTAQQEQTAATDTPAFDYDRLAGILAGRQAQNEESVLKGYFRSMGITGDEAAQAISAFKAQKAAQTPDPARLTQERDEARAAALRSEMQTKALMMAGELGVEVSTMPYVLRMADLTGAAPAGTVDDAALRTALEKVLADIPQLKKQAEAAQTGTGFRIGADVTPNTDGDAGVSALRAAFGLPAKAK